MVEMSEPAHLTDMAVDIGIQRGEWVVFLRILIFLDCLLMYVIYSLKNRFLSFCDFKYSVKSELIEYFFCRCSSI